MLDATSKANSGTTRDRVKKHREALRASGLRPVTRWVPDTRSLEFQAEYRRQLTVLAEKVRVEPERERKFWEWMESVQCDEGWV